MSKPLNPDSWKAILVIAGVFVLSVWAFEFISRRQAEVPTAVQDSYSPIHLAPGRDSAEFPGGPPARIANNDASEKGHPRTAMDAQGTPGRVFVDGNPGAEANRRRLAHTAIHAPNNTLLIGQSLPVSNAVGRSSSSGGTQRIAETAFPTIDSFEIKAIEKSADGWRCEVTWRVSNADDIQIYQRDIQVDETTMLNGTMTFDNLPEGTILTLRAFRRQNEVHQDATVEPPA